MIPHDNPWLEARVLSDRITGALLLILAGGAVLWMIGRWAARVFFNG